MNISKLSDIITNQHALEAAKSALKDGLIVFASNENYFSFSDGDRFGYIQFDSHGSCSLILEYQPSIINGSGALFRSDFYIPSGNYARAMRECLHFSPIRLTGGTEKYYKSVSQFIKTEYSWCIDRTFVFHGDIFTPASYYLNK